MGQSASTPAANAALSTPSQAPAKCPVDHSAMKKKADTEAAQCPVQHDVNPLNQMPELQQHPISSNQSTSLPTERVVSTIPRDERAKWEYPSPQQFYNALVKKGWETPENHIETMVEIHNFLNEQAWSEVVRWEERVNGLDMLSSS
jgi:cytochrome c heme-lyase